MLEFTCNICGATNRGFDRLVIHRELLPCANCGSCPRFRGIVHAVQQAFLGTNTILRQADTNKRVTGLGFSDSNVYATEFSRIFSYTNTFFHQEPILDITNTASVARYQPVDFVICSDVLEHVPPPAITAFENLRRLVKQGGTLFFSVPYLEGYETIEHYPHLYQWRVVKKLDGRFIVENLRRGDPNRPGREPFVETFERPEFHGGPGEVLEMRIYGEGDLLARLDYAGFHSVTPLEPVIEAIGYVWESGSERPEWHGRKGKGWILVCR
jgi:SAM-dependent methyltransferase